MFSHEKLNAYKSAIEFNAWVHPILEGIPKKLAARDQLDRAATSMALNLAEGNGKFSKKDRARYWQIAHGSCLECAACLDVLVARKALLEEKITSGKEIAESVANMIFGLLDRLGVRIEEEQSEYGNSRDEDQEDD